MKLSASRTLLAPLALGAVLASTPAFADDIPETLVTDTSGNLPEGLTMKEVIGKEDPKATAKVLRVLTWNEGNGKNLAVFATTEKTGLKNDTTYWSKVLYVTTFHAVDGGYEKVEDIKEVINPCELDLVGNFLERSITLTNLDGDDQAELTFGYVTGCAGDVSPSNMKVLMLERKAKYALRGESRVDIGNGTRMGGTYKVDFKKAPPAFLEHAKKVWAANMDQN